MSHVNTLDFLQDEIMKIAPQIRITIDIGTDFDLITLDYDFLYGTSRIHPMSEKKILIHENTLIARDLP